MISVFIVVVVCVVYAKLKDESDLKRNNLRTNKYILTHTLTEKKYLLEDEFNHQG